MDYKPDSLDAISIYNPNVNNKLTCRILSPPNNKFWIPIEENPILDITTQNYKNTIPNPLKNIYAYDEYSGIYDIPCSVCGGATYFGHTIDNTCFFCVLLSPHCNITIDFGISNSKNYKKAEFIFNSIKKILSLDSKCNKISMNTYDMCSCINEIKALILIAGQWKNFNCYLGTRKIKSDLVYQLLSYLSRILKIEKCSKIQSTIDGTIVMEYL